MSKWQCVECGHFIDGTKPPDACPGCHAHCTYADVTCYRPECGGPPNPDPMVMTLITQRIGLVAPMRPTQPPKPSESVSVEKVTQAALFQGLDQSDVNRVLGIGRKVTYNAGETVFKEGDDAVNIYFVMEGQLAIQTSDKQTIYTAVAGDVLGWSTLVLPYKRTASAIAYEKLSVVVIDNTKFHDFCEQNHAIGYKITRNVGRMMAVRMRTAKAMSADMAYG